MNYKYVKDKWSNGTEHAAIFFKILGRRMRKGECMHHIDENKANNSHDNLVICPSESYHRLLHYRANAMEATGSADAIYCRYCKKFEADLTLMHSRPMGRSTMTAHRTCILQAHREQATRRRAKKGWKKGPYNIANRKIKLPDALDQS